MKFEFCEWFFFFQKIRQYKISQKSVRWEASCSMRKRRRTEKTKLIVSFRNLRKSLKIAVEQKLCNNLVSCDSDGICNVHVLYPVSTRKAKSFYDTTGSNITLQHLLLVKAPPPSPPRLPFFRSHAPNPSAWPSQQVDGFRQRLRVSRRRRFKVYARNFEPLQSRWAEYPCHTRLATFALLT